MEKRAQAEINGGFWKNYQEIVREKMIPYQWAVLNDEMDGVKPSHVIANFEIAAGRREGHHDGMVFQDSDLYKWIEAAAYSLKNDPDSELEKKVDWAIDLIEEAQLEDGYIDTYYQLDGRIGERWTNLRDNHELYCAGHLIEAAVAYAQATGKKKLLEVAERLIGQIEKVFLTEGCKGYSGHEEIELALVRMYQESGEKRCLELAEEFLKRRGTEPHYFDLESRKYHRGKQSWWDADYTYSQSHEPVTEQREAVGHAVRAMYLYCAMTDVARLTGDQKMKEAAEALWNDVTERKMSVNGGIGASDWGESFSAAYDLPNDTVYNETCASVGLVFWAKRMLLMNGDSRYADIMENALYNGCLCGMDMEGEHFFYVNPLEINHTSEKRKDHEHVRTERKTWFNCACCPPNLARLITSLGDYIYRVEADEVFIDLYAQSAIKCNLHGNDVKIIQETEYPWDGKIRITVETDQTDTFLVTLRVPAWVSEGTVSCAGKLQTLSELEIKKGYMRLKREWKNGDIIEVSFPMEVKEIYANTKVAEDIGKVAVSRGPLIYCVEEKDNGRDLAALILSDEEYEILHQENFAKEIVFLKTAGVRLKNRNENSLYSYEKPVSEKQSITLIPYYLWGNRGYGEMAVWLRKA